ncbi:MAG: hypothetical protein COA30_00540 [Sulfurimonas sp.]|nr:MAG: hypothetical protein COA30_00540 [Sulfurimonas sp.]
MLLHYKEEFAKDRVKILIAKATKRSSTSNDINFPEYFIVLVYKLFTRVLFVIMIKIGMNL